VNDGQLDAGGYTDPALASSDTESCLVLVTSHLGAAPLVESVTTEARRRVMASPMLGAFIDLRFMHLGPQPGHGGEGSQALARITSQLLQPRIGVGRGFFAVVVLDRSATATETVLRECEKSPFLRELPLRLRGIASQEDRRKVRVPDGAELLVSPRGGWRREELVGEIRRYADGLLNELAGGKQRGVTPAELAGHRDRYEAHAEHERAVIPRAGVPTTGGFPAISATGGLPAIPDALATAGGRAPVPPSLPPAQDALNPRATGGLGQQAQPWPPQDTGSATPSDEVDEAAKPSGRPLARVARRLIPGRRWRQAGDGGDDQPPKSPPTASGLVYLIPTGDERSGDLAMWARSRAMILDVDKKLAVLPGIACQVRVLQGDENSLHGDLRAAGQLGKRDFRGAVADLYFAEVLDEIHDMLGRDAGRSTPALPLLRPMVVFFAPQPPLADSGAVRSFQALALDASIAWVVPKSESDMLAEDLMTGGRLLTRFESLADDLATLLTQDGQNVPGTVTPAG
jgi:hypothetical protein